ncbi:hypothetical protein ABH940_006465 [Streptacidiphilus sp. BW17]
MDEFGPLGVRPTGGSCWAKAGLADVGLSVPRSASGVFSVASGPCVASGAGGGCQEVELLPISHQRWMPELSSVSGTPSTFSWVAAYWLLCQSGTTGTSRAMSCWICA